MSQNLEDYIPHRQSMLLLDRILEVNEEQAVCEVNIEPSALFFADGQMPAWVGIEYMAQTVSVYAGNIARKAGETPSVGFLLGARKYQATVPAFLQGQRLVVKAQPIMIDGPIGSFKSSIQIKDQVVAEATITTFKPDQKMLDEMSTRGRQ